MEKIKFIQPKKIMKKSLYLGLEEKELITVAVISTIVILLSLFNLKLLLLLLIVFIYLGLFIRVNDGDNIYCEVKKRLFFKKSKKVYTRKEDSKWRE